MILRITEMSAVVKQSAGKCGGMRTFTRHCRNRAEFWVVRETSAGKHKRMTQRRCRHCAEGIAKAKKITIQSASGAEG